MRSKSELQAFALEEAYRLHFQRLYEVELANSTPGYEADAFEKFKTGLKKMNDFHALLVAAVQMGEI